MHTRQPDDTASRLIDALNHDRFVLHRQPIVPLAPREGDACAREGYQEIYVRFQEEEDKLLPPGTFIPVLESCGLMHLLDRWVINRVIRWMHAARRHDPQWSAPCSSINLSTDTVVHPDTAHFIVQQVQRGRISGRKLAFELAESDARIYHEHLAALTRELKPLGCRFTLTGYEGAKLPPGKLAALGVDTIKLPVDLVTALHATSDSVRRVRAVHQACAAAGITTIAECVERQDTVEHLLGLGVNYVQGYGIGLAQPLVAPTARATVPPATLR